MSGEGLVEFRDSNVLHFRVAPGDFVYVPAGTPHRIRAEGPMVQLRYKALDPGREVVSWHCPECSTELWHREFDATSEIPQRVYLEATRSSTATTNLRRCAKCSAIAPGGRRLGHPVGRDRGIARSRARGRTSPARRTAIAFLRRRTASRCARTCSSCMRTTTTQLLPLFPYLGPGAMLPAGALFRGRPGCGVRALLPSQQRGGGHDLLRCAERARRGRRDVHRREDARSAGAAARPNDPNAFLVSVITQRQQDEGREQKESVIFRCSECNNKLHQVDYSAELPDPDRPDLVTGGRDRRRVRHVPHHVGQHPRHRLVQLRREGAHLHPVWSRQRTVPRRERGVGRTTSTATKSSTRHDICSTRPRARPRRPRQPSEASAASPR